jgi:hypothetical protein
VLVISCAWMLFTPRETVGVPAGPYPGTRPGDDLWRSAQPQPEDGLWATAARAGDDADADSDASDAAPTEVPAAPDPGPPAVDRTEPAAAVNVPPRSAE